MEFNDAGNLEPGLHKMSVAEFKETFVDRFDTSLRRAVIFDSIVEFVKDICAKYNIVEIWIDGSYVTKKINPNDADMVVFFEIEDYMNIYSDWGNIRDRSNLDLYAAAVANEDTKKKVSPLDYNSIVNNRNYWKGQFGFDRSDTPKGLAVVTIEEWNKYFSLGGDGDVVSVNDGN